ncbi:MAG: chemotaxis protein [Thiomonas sp.]|uniref:chemotaxis protein n=1 Tax=Thiomonas sp. TaxID=2047785 RepID=UPI002A3626C0|nr:chemotaxis protein [Thiomonas sp.]MDY0331281.1 chemotaxis protein [Thiomonas sp.]
MPATWMTAIGAALPYIESVAKIALPVFKQRKTDKEAAESLHRQIEELQTAVTHNAEHVRALAQQLQTTVTALEQAGVQLAAAQQRLRLWMLAALALGAGALALGILALLR